MSTSHEGGREVYVVSVYCDININCVPLQLEKLLGDKKVVTFLFRWMPMLIVQCGVPGTLTLGEHG